MPGLKDILSGLLGGALGKGAPKPAAVAISAEVTGGEIDLGDEEQQVIVALTRELHDASQWSRRLDVRRMYRARSYYKGEQFVYWDSRINAFTPLGGAGTGIASLQQDDDENYEVPKTLNVYRAYGHYIISVLSGGIPTVRFYPRDADKSEDVATAAAANDIWEMACRENRMDSKLADQIFFLYNDGKFGAYVRHRVDGERYGYSERPIIEAREQEIAPAAHVCPQCGAQGPANAQTCPDCGAEFSPFTLRPAQTAPKPEVVGAERIANGTELVTIHGGLEIRVPPDARDQSEYQYLCLTSEYDISTVRAMYPQQAKKITATGGQASGSSDETERFYRQILKSQTGGTRPSATVDDLSAKVTLLQIWFRPSAFWRIQDEGIRARFQERYPSGLYVAMVGTTICEVRDENMDDHWVVCHAMPGDGQVRESLGDCLLDVQDCFNDLINAEITAGRHSVGTTFVDEKVVDLQSWAKTDVDPGKLYPVTRKGQEPLANGFWQMSPGDVSPQTVRLRQELGGELAQFLSGSLPAMMGAEMTTQRTASGYRMARDQALGRMGVTWREIKEASVQIATKVVAEYIRNRREDVSVAVRTPSGFKNKTIRIDDLKGQVVCYPETDEQFPVSPSDKREVLTSMMNSPNPLFQQGTSAPDNFDLIKGLLGIADLKLPGEAPRAHQYKEIDQLIRGEAIDDVDPQTGAPVRKPSVPVDELLDDHQTEFQTIQSYAWSEDGQACMRENPKGWENLRLHAQAHWDAFMKQQNPQQQQQAPPPPGPAGLPSPGGAEPGIPGEQQTPEVAGQVAPADPGAGVPPAAPMQGELG